MKLGYNRASITQVLNFHTRSLFQQELRESGLKFRETSYEIISVSKEYAHSNSDDLLDENIADEQKNELESQEGLSNERDTKQPDILTEQKYPESRQNSPKIRSLVVSAARL
jgi:hypothetical protein